MSAKLSTPLDVRTVRYASLVAGTLGAMYGEWLLARQTGMNTVAAGTYPVCLDLYAYVAFRLGRRGDVGVALALMALSQALTHLVSAHIMPMCWPIVVTVWAGILPTVLWRIHAAAHTTPEHVEPEHGDELAPVDEPPAHVEPEHVEPEHGRRNLARADALRLVGELVNAGVRDNAEIAARLGRTVRMVRNYRRELEDLSAA